MESTTILRITGVIFIIAGAAIIFNILGAATSIDMLKDGPYKIYGGVLIAVGIIDLFFLPSILSRRSDYTLT